MTHPSDYRWWLVAPSDRATISVIDKPSESYSEYYERKKREEGARRVPFGFSRALIDEEVKEGL